MKKTFYCKFLKIGICFEYPITIIGLYIPSNFVQLSFGFISIWITWNWLIWTLGSILGSGIYFVFGRKLYNQRFFYPTLGMMKYYFHFFKIHYLKNGR